MKPDYTCTITFMNKEYETSFAVFFWISIAVIAVYGGCLYAAFHVIGWFALIYLTVIPITINGNSLNPWHDYISVVIWVSLIACAGYFFPYMN